jgi:protein-S-isoprenylcysteine O-methyltransferase Ste14
VQPERREKLTDVAARVFVGVLFVLLSYNILGNFAATGRVTGLLLLVSEALVVVLVVVRRRARLIDRSAVAAAATIVSMAGPPLLRTVDQEGAALLPDAATAAILAAGLLLGIAGKIALGRSFGLVPANRGVVAGGPYQLVRHPIYTGYLISHVAFLAAHPSMRNLVIMLAADGALIIRALFEERVLLKDDRYRDYCGRVSWHLVPGVF